MTRLAALAGIVLSGALLAACGAGGPGIKSQVLAPAPSQPFEAFFLEKAEVQSRDTGEEAWQRNQEYGRLLTEGLREAMTSAGKTLTHPPAAIIRPRVYLAWGDPALKKGVAQGDKARIEVRLQVIDGDTKAVRYSTITSGAIAPEKIVGYEYGSSRDTNVRAVIDAAIADFVSRL